MTERFIGRIACVLLATAFIAGGDVASAGPIGIAWDPSPDPQVVGYRVYVGTEPGKYTETFDVGSLTTSFNYNPFEARTYYFAVSSYAAGSVVGPRSNEVSTFGSPTASLGPVSSTTPDQPELIAPPDPASYWKSLWASTAQALSTPIAATRHSDANDCVDASRSGCESVRTVITTPVPINALAATNDGRVFFVESGRRIRAMESDTVVAGSVLEQADPAVVLTDVVVDPAFADTGMLYVGEIESRPDGRREFRVVRYRVHDNVAADRVTIVQGIPLSGSGEPHLTIDSARRLHISAPSSGLSAAPTTILRLNADGTVPFDNPRGGAIVSEHPNELAAIAAVGEHLWLFDGRAATAPTANAPRLFASPLAKSSREAARPQEGTGVVSFAARRFSGGFSELMALFADGRFSRTTVDAAGVAGPTSLMTIGRSGVFGRVTTNSQGVAYITVTNRSMRGVTSSILRVGPGR